MKPFLYGHWADNTAFMSMVIILMLASFFKTTPWVIILIWFQFAVYLLHQFEEHVFPGHFKEFINQEIFHSSNLNAPLNTVAVFWINILAIWILFPIAAVCAQNISPDFGLLLPIFGLFNATLHILMFVIKKRYNPGLMVSTFLNYPTGIYTLCVMADQGYMSTTAVLIAFLVTLLAHATVLHVVFAQKHHLDKHQAHQKF